MSDGQIHFEVFARRNQNANLVLEMATEDRARAMAYAEELLESGSVAVRVSKPLRKPRTTLVMFEGADGSGRALDPLGPARTLGPDIVAGDFSGWWVYVAGDAIGAVIAVCLIGLVRGLPDRAEIDAAKGAALSG